MIDQSVCLKNKLENKLFQEKEDTNRKVGCGNDASNHMRSVEWELITLTIFVCQICPLAQLSQSET